MSNTEITQEFIDLCRDEMNAISEASVRLWQEKVDRDAEGQPWVQAQLDRRRAELYREHLDEAGIAIIRVK